MANVNIEEVLDRLEGLNISELSATDLSLYSAQLSAFETADVSKDIRERMNKLRYQIGIRQNAVGGGVFDKTNAEKIFDSGVDEFTPSQLSELRVALVRANSDKVKDLDALIVRKAKEYADGKNVILKSEDKYKLQELLTLAKDNPNLSEEVKSVANEAKAVVDQQIKDFEEYYGIDEEHLVDIEKATANLSALGEMPKDEQLFEREKATYTPISPSEYADVKTVLNNYNDNNLPEISVLAGALQCQGLDVDDRKKLERWAVARIKKTKEKDLKGSNDIANFNVLQDQLKENNEYKKVEKKSKKIYESAKEKYEANLPLVNKEFTEINDVLDRIVFTGDLKPLGREKFKGKDDEEMKALFKEQVRQETIMYLANTTKGEISEEAFKEEYVTRLQLGVLKMHASDEVLKGTINSKNASEEFTKRFSKLIDSDKKIEISRASLSAFHASSHDASSTAAKRLSLKPGYHPVAKQHNDNISNVDKKCEKKHGALHNLVKTALTSGGWGTAYAIGASFGAAGVAVVGAASFGVSVYGLVKDFKKQKAEAKAKGNVLSFWSYMKQNPKRVISTCLSAATACLGGLSAAQVFADPTLLTIAQTAVKTSSLTLGASNILDAYRKAPEGQKWKHAATAALSFGVGFITGRAVGGMVSDYIADHSDRVTGLESNTSANARPTLFCICATEHI